MPHAVRNISEFCTDMWDPSGACNMVRRPKTLRSKEFRLRFVCSDKNPPGKTQYSSSAGMFLHAPRKTLVQILMANQYCPVKSRIAVTGYDQSYRSFVAWSL